MKSRYVNGLRTYTDSSSGRDIWSVNYGDFADIYDLQTSVSGDHRTPNPHVFTHQFYQCFGGAATSTFNFNGTGDFTVHGPTGCAVALHDTNLTGIELDTYNECLSKFYEKLRMGVDLSVDLGQIRQTADMIRKVTSAIKRVNVFDFSDIRDVYRAYQRAKRDPRIAIRGIGSKWLEWVYGWKPLMSDVYGCAAALTKPQPIKMIVRARASQKARTTGYTGFSDNLINSSYHDAIKVRSERVEMVAHFNLGGDVLQALGDVTSLNPASIAWELTPYSFVADWFFDIGSYLRNLETALLYRSSFTGGYQTVGIRVRTEATSVGVMRDVDRTITYDYGSSYNQHSFKQRYPFGPGAIPMPRLPQFKADLGSGRLLNLAGLLSQGLGTSRSKA